MLLTMLREIDGLTKFTRRAAWNNERNEPRNIPIDSFYASSVMIRLRYTYVYYLMSVQNLTRFESVANWRNIKALRYDLRKNEYMYGIIKVNR